MGDEHKRLIDLMKKLPTDYQPWGKIERWEDKNKVYGDCSSGCKWARWLEDHKDESLSLDWCVCTNSKSPRCGLLTFEHQGCLDYEWDEDGE
jgi:hypothetical protein